MKATDGGDSPQEGWCTFRVNIIDENDNDPVFSSDSYSETLPEASAVIKKVCI